MLQSLYVTLVSLLYNPATLGTRQSAPMITGVASFQRSKLGGSFPVKNISHLISRMTRRRIAQRASASSRLTTIMAMGVPVDVDIFSIMGKGVVPVDTIPVVLVDTLPVVLCA